MTATARSGHRRHLAALTTAVLVAVSGMLALLVGLAGPAASADRTVKIGAALSTADLTVQPGTTVTWQVDDGGEHRVRSTSGPVEFDSGNFTGTWSFTFDTVGSYAYVDHRHKTITGSVTVSTSAPANGGGGGGGGGQPPAAKQVAVSMANKVFSPVSVTVALGGTVTWTNNDSMPHNVTSTSGAFRSATLNPGQKFSFTFTKAGSYGYFCTFHGGMSGTVVVPTAAGAAPPPASGGGGGAAPSPSASTDAGGGGGGGGSTSKTIRITLKDSLFSPSSVSAHVGDTIVWTNAGQMPHTVTANDKSFDQQLMPGATFRYVLRKQGTVAYICIYHPGMKGTLTVGAAPAGVKLPPPGAGSGVSGNAPAPAKAAPPPPAPKGDGTKTIEIKATEMTFTPKMADAHVGDTISWVNTGTIPHTVTAKDGSFDKTLQPGDRFNYVLLKAGDIDYVCTFHPGMVGMLMVKPALAGVKVPAAGSVASADDGPAPPAVHRHGDHLTFDVQAKDHAFSPALVQVQVGDTVVWTNVGAVTHRIKAADGSFDKTIGPGKSYRLTVTTPGTFHYEDPDHGSMFGALVVRPASAGVGSSRPLAGLPLGKAGAGGAALLALLGLGAIALRRGPEDDLMDDVPPSHTVSTADDAAGDVPPHKADELEVV